MIPAKNRERKCSTCKHYQPSPLWRKGWCRNPLLYDRNTNHLVEAESLACNRTFIDYWEPVEGPARSTAPQARAAGKDKPRIAPSIPVETVDAQGNRDVTTGATPAAGMPAMAARQLQPPDAAPGAPPAPARRERPPLSLVNEYYDEEGIGLEDDVADTRAFAPPARPEGRLHDGQPVTARQRIRDARYTARRSWWPLSGTRLWVALGLLAVVLIVAVGAFLLLKKGGTEKVPVAATGQGTPTAVLPTPTGFGDATATSLPQAAASPTGVAAAGNPGTLAIGGWAQVKVTSGNLLIRSEPSTAGKQVTRLANGSVVHIVAGPQTANGYTWWQVDNFNKGDPTARGWCAGEFLTPTTAP